MATLSQKHFWLLAYRCDGKKKQHRVALKQHHAIFQNAEPLLFRIVTRGWLLQAYVWLLWMAAYLLYRAASTALLRCFCHTLIVFVLHSVSLSHEAASNSLWQRGKVAYGFIEKKKIKAYYCTNCGVSLRFDLVSFFFQHSFMSLPFPPFFLDKS